MDILRSLPPAVAAAVLAGTLVTGPAAASPAPTTTAPTTAPTAAPTAAPVSSPATPSAPASSAPAGPRPPAGTGSRTGVVGPCQVVATSRQGRAWLPAAELSVPGGRVDEARVRSGVARVDVVEGRLQLQRTSRRSPGASAPVELSLTLVGPDGTSVHSCTVDLGSVRVDPSTRLRRVARAG